MKSQHKKTQKTKQPYCKPLLTCYGGIAQLTRTASGDCQDNANAFNNAELNCITS